MGILKSEGRVQNIFTGIGNTFKFTLVKGYVYVKYQNKWEYNRCYVHLDVTQLICDDRRKLARTDYIFLH